MQKLSAECSKLKLKYHTVTGKMQTLENMIATDQAWKWAGNEVTQRKIKVAKDALNNNLSAWGKLFVAQQTRALTAKMGSDDLKQKLLEFKSSMVTPLEDADACITKIENGHVELGN